MTPKDYENLLNCNHDTTCIINYLEKNNLFGCEFTLEEIGKVLGVTRERVRQIEASAFKKLKHPKIGRKLKTYIDL